eukprot:PhM_4_TR2101/c2_g1_i1/m.6482
MSIISRDGDVIENTSIIATSDAGLTMDDSSTTPSSVASSGSGNLLLLRPALFGFDDPAEADANYTMAQFIAPSPPSVARVESNSGKSPRPPLNRTHDLAVVDDTDNKESKTNTVQVRSFMSRLAAVCLEADPMRSSELRWCTRYVDTALMFLDISGYSAAAAKLSRQGAHALAEAVNSYYSRILDVVVARYSGDVITFAGDAMLVAWNYDSLADSCEKALRCAMDVQNTCGIHVVEIAAIDDRGGDGEDDEDEDEDGAPSKNTNTPKIAMRLHIGLTCGRTRTQVLRPRDAKQCFHYVGGEALHSVERVVESAKPGEVCLSLTFAETLPENVVTESHHVECDVIRVDAVRPIGAGGCCAGAHASCPLKRFRPSKDSADNKKSTVGGFTAALQSQMMAFVPPVVYAKMLSGFDITDLVEMRHLHVMFIKCAVPVDVSVWFEELFAVLNKFRVGIVQVLEDDKGLHVIAAVNLYSTENNASDHAVKVARALRRQNLGFHMGVASGPVFCGIVGSVHARRWDITGAACVRACRLMQYAETEKLDVAFDASLVDTLSEYSFVRLYRDDVRVKGSDAPVSVFKLRQCVFITDSQLNSICGLTRFTRQARQQERAWI